MNFYRKFGVSNKCKNKERGRAKRKERKQEMSLTHSHRKRLLGLTNSGEVLSLATYNLGTNVVLNKVKGSEAAMVARCKQAYVGTNGWNNVAGLSECTKTALDAVCTESFDFLALQEVPQQSAERVLNYLRTRFFTNFGKLLDFYCNQDTYLIANTSRVGKGTVITPPLLNIVEDGRPYLGVWFPQVGTFVVAVHAPHMPKGDTVLTPLQELNSRVRKQFQARLGGTEMVRACVMMGDFNEDICAEQFLLLEKVLHCANFYDETKTCCYPEFKYRSDLIFSSIVTPFPLHTEIYKSGQTSITTTALSSDHRLVRANVAFDSKSESQFNVQTK